MTYISPDSALISIGEIQDETDNSGPIVEIIKKGKNEEKGSFFLFFKKGITKEIAIKIISAIVFTAYCPPAPPGVCVPPK
jgi:hypothetical protein